jgi:hypothetical protein
MEAKASRQYKISPIEIASSSILQYFRNLPKLYLANCLIVPLSSLYLLPHRCPLIVTCIIPLTSTLVVAHVNPLVSPLIAFLIHALTIALASPLMGTLTSLLVNFLLILRSNTLIAANYLHLHHL